MDNKGKLAQLLEKCPYLDVLGGLSYWDEAAEYLLANGVRLETKEATSDKTSDYPITNGDKIRAMSDKELAGFLAGKFTDFTTQRKMELGEIRTATAISAEAHLWFTAWMQWLRMSVEEKENEDFVKRMSRM